MFTSIGRKAIISISFFVALSVFILIPRASVAGDTIKIGLVDPFSGPFEYAGRLYLAATQFAVIEQNAKGGLLGKKLEIVTADNELKPDVAVRKAKKMILEENVDLIGFGTGTHIGIAMHKFATSYKTLVFNYGVLANSLQGEFFSPYAFRFALNAHGFASALAQLMTKKPYRKFYIICQDYAWGHDMAKAFERELKNYLPDAEIVGRDFHPIATKDFGPYITKVKAAGADAIFTSNWGIDALLLIKQARSLGLKSPFPFVMTFGLDPYLENELKDAAVGIFHAYDYTLRVNTPENKDFIKRYYEKVGSKEKDYLLWWPETSIGRTAIAWKMVFAAIEKAGSVKPDKLVPALEGFSFETPVGKWTMRACDHQVLGPLYGGEVTLDPNPWFNGSIDPKINFPWLGPNIVAFDASSVAIPATADYNPRCK
jgi:branched-chain amino acid transport system substrate-binding protein